MRRGLRHLRGRGRLARRRAPNAVRAGIAAFVARGTELALAALAFALLPVLPFAAAAVAGDASYVWQYAATLRQSVRHIRGAVRGRSVSRYLEQRLAPRPLARDAVVGACTHCGNCCLFRGCVYLAYDAQGRSQCRIYGGRVWKLLACGDYPTGARDIALYDCPSFSVPGRPAAGARVIPIAVAQPEQPAAARVRAAVRSRAGE
jgi:hypothetical protein